MVTAAILRNGLTDKLLTLSYQDYLQALSQLTENSGIENNPVTLTDEQFLMLQMSDKTAPSIDEYHRNKILDGKK